MSPGLPTATSPRARARSWPSASIPPTSSTRTRGYVVLSFLASGEPYAPLRPGQPIYRFSDMEDRLASDPEFARSDLEESSPAGGTADDADGLAVRLHALRVFRSAAPGHHYLLAVYRHRG